MREIILDVPRIVFDENGVKDFFWPLSWTEHHAVRDSFLTELSAFVRSGFENDDEDADILAILFIEYTVEALRGWYNSAVPRRFSAAGCSLVVDPTSGLSEAAGRWANPRKRLALLQQRFSSSRWRSALRPLYGVFQNDGFSWRYPALIDFEHALIATDPCTLSRAHARSVDEPVFLVSMRYWLGDLCKTLPADVSPLAARPATIDSVIAITCEAVAATGDIMPDSLIRYLRDWLITATGTVRFYLDGLRRSPERLPKRLWTGSGGYVFRRILHVAVRRAGGHSVSHDHGSGLGSFSIIEPNLSEFVSPDEFMTFNPAQAEGYRRQRREELRICRQWPEITSISQPNPEPAPPTPRQNLSRQNRKIETIMFIANPYRGEQMVITPIEFDVVAVDWQARLFRWLRDEGYNVINKAHPDSMILPPPAFVETLGIPALLKPLEQVMDQADLYILDYLHTSALGTILKSDKPVLYIDFDHCALWPEAGRLFSRRVQTVHGWHDGANRLQVDWQELRLGIRQSSHMTEDSSFVDTYMTQA